MAELLGFHPGVRGFDSRSRHLVSQIADCTCCTFRVTKHSEVTRPDEDTVLKTAAVEHRCGFESHGFRFTKHERLWCNGSTTDSKPVCQGSNPWGRALKFEGGSLKREKRASILFAD